MSSPREAARHRDFSAFFAATYNCGRAPFPWQCRLAEAEALPEVLDLPTGSGKTSILDILFWRALRAGEVPRLVYVVDRRLVVDDVFHHAQRLGRRWGFPVHRWRGGLLLDESGMLDPAKPTILVSTVDQVGSRLLFRGYGMSWKERPIPAGLLAWGTTWVLDEVHLSRPFAATLHQVAERIAKPGLVGWPRPLRVLEMSATPGDRASQPFRLDAADRAHPSLSRRLATHKRARLVKAKRGRFCEDVLEEAERLAQDGRRVGILVNRARDARTIYEHRARHHRASPTESLEPLLLTGRIREIDRHRLLEEIGPLRPAEDRPPLTAPLFVVATQTLEVGVDVDFDALVTEAAPISVLRQRFGRLDRLGLAGTTEASIVLRAKGKKPDPIYGADLETAWKWLWARRTGPKKTVDLGLAAELDVPTEAEPELFELGDTEFDVLAETHSYLAVDVSIDRLLHGSRSPAYHVSVVWRHELEAPPQHWPDLIGLVPPVRGEMLSVPLWEVRQWLGKLGRPALLWRLGDEPSVVAADAREQIRPEDVVIVPCDYGGCDAFGWNHEHTERVADVGNEAYQGRGRRIERYFGEEPSRAKTPYPEELGIEGGFSVFRDGDRETSAAVEAQTLSSHQERALAAGRGLLAGLQLPESLRHDVLVALREHDAGKLDPRFQVMLFEGDEIGATLAEAEGAPRAKSTIPWWNRLARRRAFEASGLPRGWRHELESLERGHFTDANDLDLVHHLVAAHHGRGRPHPFPGPGQACDPIAASNRFWRLVERYGPWGLAWLEALVRLADRRASADPEENPL